MTSTVPKMPPYPPKTPVSPVPRPLTREEMVSILDALPYPLAADNISSRIAYESMRSSLYDQLREIKLVPEALKEFKETIISFYNQALVPPGESIGSLAAESLSESIAQLNLNSFSKAGMNEINSSLGSVLSVIKAVQTIHNPTMIVNFRERVMPYDVLNTIRSQIVSLSVGSLVKDYEIYTRKDFDNNIPWWVETYASIYGPLPNSSYICVLTMDINALFQNHITLDEVAASLMNEFPHSNLSIPSPLREGSIVVFPRDDFYALLKEVIEKKKKKEETAKEVDLLSIYGQDIERSFLSVAFIPKLDNTIIRGVPNIKNIVPATINLRSLMVDEELEPSNPPGVLKWKVYLNYIEMRSKGVSINEIADVFRKIDGKVSYPMVAYPLNKDLSLSKKYPYTYIPRFIYVTMPPGSSKSPLETLQAKIQENNELQIAKTKETLKNGSNDYYTPFTRTITFTYGIIEGINVPMLAINEHIDIHRSIPDNIHLVEKYFGIEAARNYISMRVNSIFVSTSLYVDPRHIFLLADAMTNRGIVTPITSPGLIKQGMSTIDNASMSNALDIVTKASAMGITDTNHTVSSHIFTSSWMENGSGYITPLNATLENINNGLFGNVTNPKVRELIQKRIKEMKNWDPMDFDFLNGINTEYSQKITTENMRNLHARVRSGLVYNIEIPKERKRELQSAYKLTPPREPYWKVIGRNINLSPYDVDDIKSANELIEIINGLIEGYNKNIDDMKLAFKDMSARGEKIPFERSAELKRVVAQKEELENSLKILQGVVKNAKVPTEVTPTVYPKKSMERMPRTSPEGTQKTAPGIFRSSVPEMAPIVTSKPTKNIAEEENKIATESLINSLKNGMTGIRPRIHVVGSLLEEAIKSIEIVPTASDSKVVIKEKPLQEFLKEPNKEEKKTEMDIEKEFNATMNAPPRVAVNTPAEDVMPALFNSDLKSAKLGIDLPSEDDLASLLNDADITSTGKEITLEEFMNVAKEMLK